MCSSGTEVRELYLQPGESCIVRIPSVLKTVLGSCVGITFRVPRLGVAAMCHAMLPSHAPHGSYSGVPPATRYVDYAIRELLQQLERLGARRDEVEVKLFGGAEVLASAGKDATVGRLNAEQAMRVLEQEGVAVRASRLGGSRGIFIEFHTETGDVLLRELARINAWELADSELRQ